MDFAKNAKKYFPVVTLLFFLVPIINNLLRPGYFYMQDDLQAFRIFELHKCVVDSQYPCRWVPDAGYGYGYPQFIFYPPLVYYFGETLHLIGFQFIDAVKILFAVGYILSALAMYWLVKCITDNKWAGFVAAILYSYIPYKAVEVYVRGAMSEFWALVFFPLNFLFSYLLIKTAKNKWLILLSLSVFALLTTHLLMSMIFFPILGVWILYWLWSTNNWKVLKNIILSGLLGVSLSAFFLLPVLFERKYVHSESMLGGYFDYRAHFVNIKNLLLDRRWGYGSSGFPSEILNLSIGIPQWLMAIGTLLTSLILWRRDKKKTLLVIIIFLTALFYLFMIHQKSSFIWSNLPMLWWLQFPWRFLSVVIFLLSILAGIGISYFKKQAFILSILLTIVAMGLTLSYYHPREWYQISDKDKFSGESWQKQQTISIFDYTPIYAKLPPPSKAPDEPEILDGEAKIINYWKKSSRQGGEVIVIKDATVRLPLFDFPGMRVTDNGQVIEHWNNDCRGQEYCLGLITFKLLSGNHKIEARLTNTWDRYLGDIITIGAFGVVLFFIFNADKTKQVN